MLSMRPWSSSPNSVSLTHSITHLLSCPRAHSIHCSSQWWHWLLSHCSTPSASLVWILGDLNVFIKASLTKVSGLSLFSAIDKCLLSLFFQFLSGSRSIPIKGLLESSLKTLFRILQKMKGMFFLGSLRVNVLSHTHAVQKKSLYSSVLFLILLS